MASSLKIVVGTPSKASSTVWTISPKGDDVYLWTWLSGGQHKVSLHASGDCQWSGTEKWVKENAHPDFRNQDRHFERWRPDRDSSGVTVLCQLLFPATDLSRFHQDDKVRADKDVLWLPPPGTGMATEINCVLCPPDVPPGDFPSSLGRTIWEHPLPSRGRLVVTATDKDVPAEVESAYAVQRLKMLLGARIALGDSLPEGLINAVYSYQLEGVYGFVELSLEEGAPIAAIEEHPEVRIIVKAQNS